MLGTHVVRQGPGAEPASIELSELLNAWLSKSGPAGLFRSCGCCVYMRTEGPAHCVKFNATPPVATILNGCDSHEDNAIVPF